MRTAYHSPEYTNWRPAATTGHTTASLAKAEAEMLEIDFDLLSVELATEKCVCALKVR